MRARLKKAAVSLLAAMVLMAMALPAASQEPDRPQNYDPPSPTTEDATADQETADDPTPPNSATFDDFVRITNPSGSGDAEIRLDGSAGDGSTQWDLENDATAGNQLQFLHGFGSAQMVLTPGGFLGLGTTSPQDHFHIANTGNDHILLEDTDGASFNLEAGGDFFDIDSTDFPLNNFRIHRDAPSNGLVVRDGVGIGTSAPQGGLHVTNVGGAPTDALVVGEGLGVGTDIPRADLDLHHVSSTPYTRMKLTMDEHFWINGVAPFGWFVFSRNGTGGVEFTVSQRNDPTATIDVQGPVRATAFNTASSSALKTAAQAVDPLEILTDLNAMPVSTWRFRGCGNGEGRLPNDDGTPAAPCSGPGEGPRHIGPMAEDFHEAFGLGDGESIATVDADGVIMASLQGLSQLLEDKDERIAELEDEVSDLGSRLDALEARLNGGPPRGGPGR